MKKQVNKASTGPYKPIGVVANYLFIPNSRMATVYRNMIAEMVFNYAFCSVGIDAAAKEDFKRMHLLWLMLGEMEDNL